MKYTPGNISAADLAIAVKHSVGGEKRLFVSSEQVYEMGTIDFTADATPAWTAHAIYTPPAAGADMVCKVDESLLSDAAAVITLAGTDATSAALSGTATFDAPTWTVNRKFDFQTGVAVDIVVPASKTWKTFIGVVTGTNAKKWSKCKVFQLPETASWVPIGMVESVDPKLATKPGVAIADGLDPAAEVTAGRGEVPEVSISALHRGIVDGLARFAGRPCSIRLDVYKQGRVLVERHVFGNCILQVNPNFPDGSETAKQAASGIMEDYFGFYAK